MQLPVWRELNISPFGASTGTQAWQMLQEATYDLVITDICMPEMDGLELARKAHESGLDLPFVILSGHDCFEYAQRAIHFGVKDYLLKPISSDMLSSVINKIILQSEAQQKALSSVELLRHQDAQRAESALEQALRHLLLHLDTPEDIKKITQSENSGQDVLLYLVHIDGKTDEFDRLSAVAALLRSIRVSLEIINAKLTAFTFMENLVLLFNENSPLIDLALATMQENSQGTDLRISASVAGPAKYEDICELYSTANKISAYRFYSSEFCVLTAQQCTAVGDAPSFDELLAKVSAHALQEAFVCLDEFHAALRASCCPPAQAHKLCTQLYLQLAEMSGSSERDSRVLDLVRKNQMLRQADFASMQRQLLSCIEDALGEKALSRYSHIVRTAIEYAKEHLTNESLSTAQLANDILFINPDYFGKLFKKETGLSFTRYLLERRMELAKELICSRPNIRIQELSELCGFGGNAQYLSQVFRASFGCTPTEYKKMAGAL